MSSGVDQLQKAYESAFHQAWDAEVALISSTKRVVLDFGNRLTTALRFPQWQLWKVSPNNDGKVVPIDDKGDVVIDEAGIIRAELYWPIETMIRGNPKKLDVSWIFFLEPVNNGYVAITAGKAHVKWSFYDEHILSQEARYLLENLSKDIAERASNDAQQEVLSNHTIHR